MAYVPPPSAIMSILRAYLKNPEVQSDLQANFGITFNNLPSSNQELIEFGRKAALDLLQRLRKASTKVLSQASQSDGKSLFPPVSGPGSYNWGSDDYMRFTTNKRGFQVSLSLHKEIFWRESLYSNWTDKGGLSDIVALITTGYQSENPLRNPVGFWYDAPKGKSVRATPPRHPGGGWGFVGKPFVEDTVKEFQDDYAGYGAKVVKLPNGWF